MSVWYIFLGLLGPMAALMVGMIIAQHSGRFRSAERTESGFESHTVSGAEPTPARLTFGQRHPVFVTVALVFGVWFLAGGFFGDMGFLLGGLVSGVVGTILFLLLSFILALIATIAQSTRYAWRKGSLPRAANGSDVVADFGTRPFHRRFVGNLEAAAGFVIQGWSP